jgi:hypothetical protein
MIAMGFLLLCVMLGVPAFLVGLLLGRRIRIDRTRQRVLLFAASGVAAVILATLAAGYFAFVSIHGGSVVTHVEPRRLAGDLASVFGCVYFTWHVLMALWGTTLGVRHQRHRAA